MPDAASTGAKRRLPAPRVEPKGRWGIWLAAQRTSHSYTQKHVFDSLRKRWPDLFPWRSGDSLDSYRAFEKGRVQPDEDQQAAFLAFYEGAEPPPIDHGRDGGDTLTVPAAYLVDLLAKLDRQADAISSLAAQVERLVNAQVAPTEDTEETAHIVAEAVVGALRVTLPAVLRAAGLPPK